MRVLYTVTAEVEPASADAWNVWHTDHHLAEVVAQPGFIRCRKWRETSPLKDGWIRFLVAFEVETLDAYERYNRGEAARRLRAEGVEKFGEKVRYQRAVYELVGAFGGMGHVAD
jgi:hypothetical protein